MAFRGHHEHSLDSKDRITIPAPQRAALADGVVVMEGVEKCVEVWPKAAAEKMEQNWIEPLNPMSADARRLRRRFFGSSDEVELDSAGRIRINKNLIEHAGLAGTALIVGAGDHFEIWNADAWSDESEQIDATTDELTERLAAQSTPGTSTGPN